MTTQDSIHRAESTPAEPLAKDLSNLEAAFGKLIQLFLAELQNAEPRETQSSDGVDRALKDLFGRIETLERVVARTNEALLKTFNRLVLQGNLLSDKFDRLSESSIKTRVEEPLLVDLLETLQAISEVESSPELFEAKYVIERAFEWRDFDLIRPEIGSPFDSKLHEAIGFTPAGEGKREGCISEIRRFGLSKRGVSCVPARVCVFAVEKF